MTLATVQQDAMLQTRLLEEYRANVELWKHDDTLRQSRNATFLTATTLLVGALGIVASGAPPLRVLALGGMTTAAFGVVMCFIWHRVQHRNAQYVRFRRFQLRHIEQQLPGLTTFAHTEAAFVRCIAVELPGGDQTFALPKSATISSTTLEGYLPLAFGVLWATVFAASVAAFAVAIF